MQLFVTSIIGIAAILSMIIFAITAMRRQTEIRRLHKLLGSGETIIDELRARLKVSLCGEKEKEEAIRRCHHLLKQADEIMQGYSRWVDVLREILKRTAPYSRLISHDLEKLEVWLERLKGPKVKIKIAGNAEKVLTETAAALKATNPAIEIEATAPQKIENLRSVLTPPEKLGGNVTGYGE